MEQQNTRKSSARAQKTQRQFETTQTKELREMLASVLPPSKVMRHRHPGPRALPELIVHDGELATCEIECCVHGTECRSHKKAKERDLRLSKRGKKLPAFTSSRPPSVSFTTESGPTKQDAPKSSIYEELGVGPDVELPPPPPPSAKRDKRQRDVSLGQLSDPRPRAMGTYRIAKTPGNLDTEADFAALSQNVTFCDQKSNPTQSRATDRTLERSAEGGMPNIKHYYLGFVRPEVAERAITKVSHFRFYHKKTRRPSISAKNFAPKIPLQFVYLTPNNEYKHKELDQHGEQFSLDSVQWFDSIGQLVKHYTCNVLPVEAFG